jgi:uncharacterized protein
MQFVDLNRGMDIIDRDECMRLLATEEVGRLGVVLGGQPEIFPVNYVVDDGCVVFRTDEGSKLDGATRGSVVFEVDHLDRAAKSAWSVILHGRADPVTVYDSPDLQRRMSQVTLYPWAGTVKQHLVRIAANSVTGRRIHPRAGD